MRGLRQFPSVAFDSVLGSFKSFFKNWLKITFAGHQKFPLLLILKRVIRRHVLRTVRLTGREVAGWLSAAGRPGSLQTWLLQTTETCKTTSYICPVSHLEKHKTQGLKIKGYCVVLFVCAAYRLGYNIMRWNFLSWIPTTF